ncbi:uncharacterized protein DUF1376 [Delftia acidovorans]|uniref:DUF1376 domain-containing protein n=1 Tax=Delftia acidovorans TaxID=80866 RepID=UPI000F4CD6BD|nr:DUF1376 domain-containing protein [Delftia acidovorans]ROR02814.1 uncharacterized protein DUF1376 [Delftia acidovorans]
MTSQCNVVLPDPMVPCDCDLSDFPFMPLDVARLRDSDLAANETPDACWAAVLLWSAAWHQVPAGSMPDNDAWIAKQAGYALRGRIDPKWKRVREGAMRGWVLCSDGRYHHAVVAEKVRDAWSAKLLQRWRTECSRIKKHNDRHGTDVRRPSYEEWIDCGRPTGQVLSMSGDGYACPGEQDDSVPGDSAPVSRGSCVAVSAESASKGQGKGKRQGHPDVRSNPGGSIRQPVPASDCSEIIFGYGLSLLVNSGTPERQARSFLGGLRKVHGDDALIDRLRACAQARPLQPLEWLAAALPPPTRAAIRRSVPVGRHGAAYAAIMEA